MSEDIGERIFNDRDQGVEPLASDDCSVLEDDPDEADGTDSYGDRELSAVRANLASLESADIPNAWVIRDDDELGGELMTSCEAEDRDTLSGLALIPTAEGLAGLPEPQVHDDDEIGAEDVTTCTAYDDEEEPQ